MKLSQLQWSDAPSHVADRYEEVRRRTVEICEPLQIEDYVVQPCAEVSPPKWHLAHTTWFFEAAILSQHVPRYRSFDPLYSRLFNSYYKSSGDHWLQGERGQLSRPTVSEIMAYRRAVDECVLALLENGAPSKDLTNVLEVGLHHEQQHQELLLMDIKRILGTNPSMPAYTDANWTTHLVNDSWADFGSGVYETGHRGEGFGYDNESPRHRQYLNAFVVRDNTVSCAEFIEFIRDGGYRTASLWLSRGWEWVQQNAVSAPMYWFHKDGTWHHYTLHGPKLVSTHEPVVHLSYYEADAFARWMACRLPLEAELELWLEKHREDASPVAPVLHPTRTDQASNQVWYWTSSHYSPYPGYRPYSGMLEEYNGKFMCNQFVLRGGCVATPSGHYRPSYRNFFEPQQRWMFSGLKLARDY